jgi:GTP:adenosylcobinamide-phosphate guanylyltransferase
MNCRYDNRDILLYYYGDLDRIKHEHLNEHLRSCAKCRDRLSGLKDTLDSLPSELRVPEDVDLKNFHARVRQKLERQNERRSAILLPLKPVYAVVVIFFVIVTVIGGIKFYNEKQEQRFIMENFELIVNIDMLEDIEIIEHLEEFGEV